MFREAIYRSFRIIAPLVFSLQVLIRLISPKPAILPDLILFNLVGIFAALIALSSPKFNDGFARTCLAAAILFWTFGSIVSTWNSFFSFQLLPNLTDFSYAFFYPLTLAGIIRALSVSKKLLALDLLDAVIIALGASSVISSLLLRPAMVHLSGSPFSVFLSILYPVGDVVLVAVALSLVVLQPRNNRTAILLIGISLFAIADLYFLFKSSTTGYSFGQLSDDGWILGLLLISESLWHPGGEVEASDRVNSIATTFSLVASSTILAIAALKPNYFPAFVLVPGFATITLAFIRMALALRDAKSVSTERALARTDELTGLPNRRKFLTELEKLCASQGTLLLLDLDGFKIINDQYGHEIGDLLLKQVSTRFLRAVPESVLIARLGGDEFGVIIPGSPELGTEIALALRATTSYPFSLSIGEVIVGVSIGSVFTDQISTTKEDLLRKADSAMYEAKRNNAGLVSWQAI